MRVRDSLNAWRKIGASPTVLNWIQYGYRLPFVRKVEPFHFKSRTCTGQEYQALDDIKRKLLNLGVVQRTSDASFVSRSRLEPKKDGGYRLVVDLRHLNQHMQQQACKYETLADLQLIIEPNDWMISADLENGYYHIGIHPSFQRFLTTEINGDLISFRALPFGLSTAPRVFTKFMRPVVAHLRKRGVRMLQYLDDSLFLAEDPSTLVKTRGLIEQLFQELGLARKLSKGVWTPTQNIKHLGIEIDTVRGLFLVPLEKRNSIMGAAKSILSYASSHRRWVHVRKLANLAGSVISLSVALPVARTVTRSLYDAIATRASWSSDVRLCNQALKDLRFLAELPNEQCDKAIWRQRPLAEIATDASDTGWGAVLNDLVPAQGFFSALRQNWHITAKELSAVFYALQQYKDALPRNGLVRITTDNMSVKAVLNKCTSASPHLMAIYRKILEFCLERGLVLEAEYIPSAENKIPDFLSRINPAGEWSVARGVFRFAELAFGKRTIDLFAAFDNRQCERFCSLIPHCLSLGDAFDHDWSNERSWICPPFAMISRVVRQLMVQGGEACIIVPYWTAAPWFPTLSNMADYSLVLPDMERVVVQNTAIRAEVFRNKRWKLALFHVPRREWTKVRC